jgi:hypothetical protein
MIRRTALATIVALAALVVVASTSHATSSITRKCIVKQRGTLKTCRASCVSDFRTNQAACFGPGLACAQTCQDDNDTCRGPVQTALDNCLTTRDLTPPSCVDTLATALDGCRAKPAGPDQDSCANQARLDNLNCQLNCRGSVDELFLACNQTFANCLGACASCATPGVCPQ